MVDERGGIVSDVTAPARDPTTNARQGETPMATTGPAIDGLAGAAHAGDAALLAGPVGPW